MKYALLVAVLMLSGCATVNRGLDYAAAAEDAAVMSAEFTICHGASVGAIRRAYGDRPDLWQEFCAGGSTFAPVGVDK